MSHRPNKRDSASKKAVRGLRFGGINFSPDGGVEQLDARKQPRVYVPLLFATISFIILRL